jgi:hypothetical protein
MLDECLRCATELGWSLCDAPYKLLFVRQIGSGPIVQAAIFCGDDDTFSAEVTCLSNDLTESESHELEGHWVELRDGLADIARSKINHASRRSSNHEEPF